MPKKTIALKIKSIDAQHFGITVTFEKDHEPMKFEANTPLEIISEEIQKEVDNLNGKNGYENLIGRDFR